MAIFDAKLPEELFSEEDALKMVDEMLIEGAEAVKDKVEANMKKSFKKTDELRKHMFVSKVYSTRDGARAIKVGFSGYDSKGTAIPLIINAREYGTSRGEAKKPFFRKSFDAQTIEYEFIKVQDKYLPKD